MNLNDLALSTETISVLHPTHGDVGVTVELHHPMSRAYNAALARLADEELPNAIVAAEAAVVAINGIDDYTHGGEYNILRDEQHFWLPMAIFAHIAKKKTDSERNLSN